MMTEQEYPPLRVAAAALNQTPLDWDGNIGRIRAVIQEAQAQSVDVLCLPELCLTGYGCEDMFLSPGVQQTAWDLLLELAPELANISVLIGLPVRYEGHLYNTACFIADGAIQGFAAKQFLAGEGIHYEQRWFTPWPAGEQASLLVGDDAYPFGDSMFTHAGHRFGVEICEDAWVTDRPAQHLLDADVDVILNPSASHFALGKHATRQRVILGPLAGKDVTYVYANLLGNEAGRALYDGGTFIAKGDTVIAAGKRFSFTEHTLTQALTITTPSTEDAALWETSQHLDEEEFTRAEALGLFDYLRKSRANGFTVSLSGGADSATVALLIRAMVMLAVKELGIAGVRQRLAHVPDIDQAETIDELCTLLLTCVYQATINSSRTTHDAAAIVAKICSARWLDLDIDDLVQGYVQRVAHALGTAPTWEKHDAALQNIQARSRAPGVWLIANLLGQILVATSNRSEAAVGYATMDGDTAGGISPLAGIDKVFIRRWLQWLQDTGSEDLAPIPELSVITTQKPSAELRPREAAQTDEDDLMPYELLEALEQAAIGNKQLPAEALKVLENQFPNYSREQLLAWVERFYTLFSRNQWKRERYAPSFHIAGRNLDPKTWCRFPILSGGFERELQQLRTSETTSARGRG